jgi:hypothetical protein
MDDTILRIIDIIVYGAWLLLFPLTLIMNLEKKPKKEDKQ